MPLAAFPTVSGAGYRVLEHARGRRFKLATEYRVWKKAILSHFLESERGDTRAERESERESEGGRTDAVT